DGGWQVRLSFNSGSRPHLAEWIFDPHRKHVAPADDTAMRLCLPDAELPPPAPGPRAAARATVTPIGSRLGPAADADQARPPERARPAERARVPAPSHARETPAWRRRSRVLADSPQALVRRRATRCNPGGPRARVAAFPGARCFAATRRPVSGLWPAVLCPRTPHGRRCSRVRLASPQTEMP